MNEQDKEAFEKWVEKYFAIAGEVSWEGSHDCNL
jgi:hypothetical protein